MDILHILIYIALISFIFLTIRLIMSLGKVDEFLVEFKNKATGIEKDVKELKDSAIKTFDSINDLKPLIQESLDKMNDLQSKSIETLSNTDDTLLSTRIAMDNINNKIEKIDNIILPFEMLAKSLYNRVAEPVNNTGKVVSAVFKAASIFASKFKK